MVIVSVLCSFVCAQERDKRHNNWQLHEQIITRGQESSLRVTKLLLKSMEPWQDQRKKNYIQN